MRASLRCPNVQCGCGFWRLEIVDVNEKNSVFFQALVPWTVLNGITPFDGGSSDASPNRYANSRMPDANELFSSRIGRAQRCLEGETRRQSTS